MDKKLFIAVLAILLVFSVALNVFSFLNKKTPTFSIEDVIKLSRNFENLSSKEQDNKILSLISKDKTIFSFNNSNASRNCSQNAIYARMYLGYMSNIIARYISDPSEDIESIVESIVESISEKDFAMLEAYTSAFNEMIDRLDDEGCYG